MIQFPERDHGVSLVMDYECGLHIELSNFGNALNC